MSSENTTTDQATDLINLKIFLNGAVMSGEYRIMAVDIVKCYNKIATARFVLADGDPAKQDFVISSTEESLTPGNVLEIQLGYHTKSKTVFKGIITGQIIKAGKNNHPMLMIEAKDKTFKLAIGRQNDCYIDKKDSDIFEDIAQAAGIADTDIQPTASSHKEMVQYNTSHWDFILSRSEMNGMLVLTDDNKLIIQKPDTAKKAALTITYGVDVMEFETAIDARWQLSNVKSYAWNYQDQKVEESQEASVQFKESGNLQSSKLAGDITIPEEHLTHSGSLTSDELKQWSNAKLLKSKLAKILGRIKVRGTTDVKPGDMIELKGFGKRFNGNLLVTGINHNYDKSIWETDIQFGMPVQWFYKKEDIVEKPAAGLVPGINGLQIGIVIQLENDPDGQDRVKIQLPLVDEHDGLWARIACTDAGDGRGSFFRPELRDEVIVGFINDDPRHPVILGMLNSSAKPAPLQAKDVNHEKGFITRSKMKVLFNDDKKTINIETPKGKKIILDEDGDAITVSDDHNNKISLSQSGVVIESGKDISLKAAMGNIKLEALNIENKANVKFSAEGTASSEINSSGMTVIKGSIVNIN